jgi:hypothetical protein
MDRAGLGEQRAGLLANVIGAVAEIGCGKVVFPVPEWDEGGVGVASARRRVLLSLGNAGLRRAGRQGPH